MKENKNQVNENTVVENNEVQEFINANQDIKAN